MDSSKDSSISHRGGVKLRGGRLPALRARDVIPGQSKTTIAPKIPQRRTIKTEPVKSAYMGSSSSDSIRKKRVESSRESRGRGRGARQYLQTEGTFLGEGPAALRIIKKEPVDTYERSSGSRSKGKIGIHGTGFLDDFDDEAYYDDSSELLSPTRLPFLRVKSEIKDVVVKKEDTQETIKIKEEPLDEDDVKNSWTDGGYFKQIKQEKNESNDMNLKSILFQNGKDSGGDPMLLIQMPSLLPFPETDISPESSKSSNKNSDTHPSACSAKGLPEGRIGKLQLTRSGQLRLVMGGITFVLKHNSVRDDVQEAVSISTEEHQSDLTVLGKVAKKMTLQPLLEKMVDGIGKEL